jgi:hypothetical protein
MSSKREERSMDGNSAEETGHLPDDRRGRLSSPVAVGLVFAAVATALSLIGLWRDDNLTLRNVALAIALGGGTWGLISWAIAWAVLDVEQDIASRGDGDG